MTWKNEDIEGLIQLEREGLNWDEIAEALGKTRDSVRKKFYRLSAEDEPETVSKSVKFDSDGTETTTALMRLKHEPDKSPETMLKLTGYDPDKFDLISSQYKVYEQHSTTDGTVPQYSITVKASPKSSVGVAELAGIINRTVTKTRLKNTSGASGDKMLVIPLYDLHFGIMTLGTFQPYLDGIVDRLNVGNYERVVIELGGDLLHSDYMKSTRTVSGTQLDHADMVRAWKDAAFVVSNIITAASQVSINVSLYAVGGNHDFDMQWAFVEMLNAKFGNDVSFYNRNNYRDAYRFGRVGIMMAHGDSAKRKLSALFASEQPEIWSSSVWREVHYGHFHTQVTTDDNGAIVRQFGTPKPTDGYEDKNGYTMGAKALKLLEYTTEGLYAEYTLLGGN